MINIEVVSVGMMKEKYLENLCDEYAKRIGKFARISFKVLRDESNQIDEAKVKEIEGKRIIEFVSQNSYKILLDLTGKMMTSEEFAKTIEHITTYDNSSITFIIGGSLGVSEQVRNLADMKLKISPMTFPHLLCKGILLEQIYRAFKILNNETYHK